MKNYLTSIFVCGCALTLAGCVHSARPLVLKYGTLPAGAPWTYTTSPAGTDASDVNGIDMGRCLPSGLRSMGHTPAYLVEFTHTIRKGRIQLVRSETNALPPENPRLVKQVKHLGVNRLIEALTLTVSQAASSREVFRVTALKVVQPKSARPSESLADALCRSLRDGKGA